MPSHRPTVLLFTDGACKPNPGVGGWAALLVSPGHEDHERTLTGAEPNTTNNRMELRAALEGLRALKKPCAVTLYTDSQYLRNAFEKKWLAGWKRRGWITAGREPVANADLWKELDRIADRHEVAWQWVRGHAGNARNERVDRLAVSAREELAATLDQGDDAAAPPPPREPMTNREVALAFVGRFCAGEVDSLRWLLADDVLVDGPWLQSEGREAYLDLLRNDPPAAGAVRIRHLSEDGDTVSVFYDYDKPTGPLTIAQLFTLREGRIAETLIVFDARN